MATTVTKRVTSASSGGQTARVSGTAAGGATTRIPPNLLALEGDESGYVLLEGDMQSGDDLLKLEGDEATSITANLTQRVSEAVV